MAAAVIGLEVITTGVKGAVADLQAVGERFRDQRPVLARVQDKFLEIEERWFDTRGGGTWAPNKPSTIAHKRKHGLDLRVLHAKGSLKRSLTQKRSKFSVQRVRMDEFEFGSAAATAAMHDQGAANRRQGGPLPRRKILGITRGDIHAAQADMANYIVTGRL